MTTILPRDAKARFEQIERATDLPMAALALLMVPALILEERGSSEAIREFAAGLNWIVWLAFCAEYLGKLTFAPSKREFAKRAWFDLVLVALSPPFLVPQAWQGVRAFRLLRLLRFVRVAALAAMGLKEAGEAFRHRRFHYVALTTVVVLVVGALGIFAVEHGENKSITTFGDALWWAVVTTTTVGYGDVSPITTEGRLIAIGLMIVGIGFIGVFTATVTSSFLEPSRTDVINPVEERLARIEDKLDTLLREKPLG